MRHQFEIGIPDVEVDKEVLRKILVKNRDAHVAVFEEALERFRVQAISRLTELVESLRLKRHVTTLHVPLPVPEEHVADYDRALRMINMHVGETMLLSEQAYSCLVEDEWGWRSSFFSNTVAYTSGFPPSPVPDLTSYRNES